MNYRIEVGSMTLIFRQRDYEELCAAIKAHEENGHCDGWTKYGNVTITEMGVTP